MSIRLEHDWDWYTSFCLRCGAALRDVVDGTRVECNDGVTAISHIISRKKFARIADRIFLDVS